MLTSKYNWDRSGTHFRTQISPRETILQLWNRYMKSRLIIHKKQIKKEQPQHKSLKASMPLSLDPSKDLEILSFKFKVLFSKQNPKAK